MRKALVTLLLGSDWRQRWDHVCRKGWERYASAHGYALVVLTEPLDDAPRARSRSPSWQKCLILSHPELKGYDRVVWLDADIVINVRNAPCIVSQTPEDKIGGTDAYSFFTPALHDYLYQRYQEYCGHMGRKLIINPTGADYYRNFGIETDLNPVIQAGVLVLNPAIHRDVLEETYARYEARIDPETGYDYNIEMRPLSYEIVRRDLHYFLDSRFNFILSNYLFLAAPYLSYLPPSPMRTLQQELTVSAAYMHAYFLHFAGGGLWRELAPGLRQDLEAPEDFIRGDFPFISQSL